jgi:hypothetical protein
VRVDVNNVVRVDLQLSGRYGYLKYDVSLVLNGHDHFYEQIKPQTEIARS